MDTQVRRALELGKGPTYLMEKLASALKPIFETLVGDMDGRFISLLITGMITDNCTLSPDMMEEDRHGRTLATGCVCCPHVLLPTRAACQRPTRAHSLGPAAVCTNSMRRLQGSSWERGTHASHSLAASGVMDVTSSCPPPLSHRPGVARSSQHCQQGGRCGHHEPHLTRCGWGFPLHRWLFSSFSGWRLWHLEIPESPEDPGRRPALDFSLQQPFNGRDRATTEQEVREELGLDSPEEIALRQAMLSGDTAESIAAAAEAQAMYIEELRTKSASKMSVVEMRQELDSYNLPSKGLRADIYSRIKVTLVFNTPTWPLAAA